MWQRKLFNNVKDIPFDCYTIHYSPVTGQIVGYPNDFCNKKTQGNPKFATDFLQTIYSVLFFSLLQKAWGFVVGAESKSILAETIWQMLNMWSYQEWLSSLAKSANENRKANIRKTCRTFLETNPTYSSVFNSFSDENKG